MSSPELSRRAALGLLAAGLVTGGCELSPAADPAPRRGPGASTTTVDPPGEQSADPDEALVGSVRSELGAALALVTAAGRRHPSLSREVAPWRQLHRRHLAALPGGTDGPSRAKASGSAARVRDLVRRQELRLQRSLATSAIASESGSLAALLASMSAAVAQQLAASDPGGRP